MDRKIRQGHLVLKALVPLVICFVLLPSLAYAITPGPQPPPPVPTSDQLKPKKVVQGQIYFQVPASDLADIKVGPLAGKRIHMPTAPPVSGNYDSYKKNIEDQLFFYTKTKDDIFNTWNTLIQEFSTTTDVNYLSPYQAMDICRSSPVKGLNQDGTQFDDTCQSGEPLPEILLISGVGIESHISSPYTFPFPSWNKKLVPGGDSQTTNNLINGSGTYYVRYEKTRDHNSWYSGGLPVIGGSVETLIGSHIYYYYAVADTGANRLWLDDPKYANGTNANGPDIVFSVALDKSNNLASQAITDAINGVLGLIKDGVSRLGSTLLGLIHDLLFSSYNNVINQTAVNNAWSALRNIVNILFILVLVAIAFANVLRLNIEQYAIRALLPRFILAVLGVNFSLILVQVGIDFSSVFSKAVFAGTLSFDKLFDLNLSGFAGAGAAGQIVTIIIMVLALIAAISVVAMLIARIAALWTLAALAPIAFLCMVLPSTRGLTTTWTRNVVRFILIGPIMALLLSIASEFAKSQGSSNRSNILSFLITVGLLYAAAIVPLMLGGAVMSMASNLSNRGTQLARRAATPVAKGAARGAGKGIAATGGAASRLALKGPGAVVGQRGLVGLGEASRPSGRYSKFLPVGLMATKPGQRVAGTLRKTPFVGSDKRLLPTRAERYDEARLATDVETLKGRGLSTPVLNQMASDPHNPRRARAAAQVAAEKGVLTADSFEKMSQHKGISSAQKADIWTQAVKENPTIMYNAYRRTDSSGNQIENRLADALHNLGPADAGGEGRLSARLSDFHQFAQRKSTGDLIKDMPIDMAETYDFTGRVISERQFDNFTLPRQQALKVNPTAVIGKSPSLAGGGTPPPTPGTPPPSPGGPTPPTSPPPSPGPSGGLNPSPGSPSGSGGGSAPSSSGGGSSASPGGATSFAPPIPAASSSSSASASPNMSEIRNLIQKSFRTMSSDEQQTLKSNFQRLNDQERKIVQEKASGDLLGLKISGKDSHPDAQALRDFLRETGGSATDSPPIPGGVQPLSQGPNYSTWHVEDGENNSEHEIR